MSTPKQYSEPVLIPYKDFHEVCTMLRENKIKHLPFRRQYPGYNIQVEDGPVASYLVLKYSRK